MKSLELSPRSDGLVHQSERTSRKAAEEAGMVNFIDFFRWQWVQRVNWRTTVSSPRILHFMDVEMHNRVQAKVIEVKKMLASLIRKIDAERRA